MRTSVSYCLCSTVGMLLLSSVALAADPVATTTPVPAKAKVAAKDAVDDTYVDLDLTVQAVSGRRQSAKFEEYRNVPSVAGNLDVIHQKDERFYLNLESTHVGLEDQHYDLRTGEYGRWKFNLSYDETPHRFAYDSLTAFQGVGTGLLSVDPALRAGLIAAPAGSAKSAVWNGASIPFDLELFRKRITADATYIANKDLSVNAYFTSEKRDGTRSIGINNVAAGVAGGAATPLLELPEPIDYKTDDGKLSVEYNRDTWGLVAAYAVSDFDNNVDTLTIQSPSSNAGSGPAVQQVSRIDLAPSNRAHNFSLSGSVRDLPWHGTLNINTSFGRHEQNDALIPMTPNVGVTNAVAANASVAGQTSGLTVDTTLLNGVYTARPTKKMRLKARYNQYDYDNKSGNRRFDFAVFADGAVVVHPAGTRATGEQSEFEPFSFRKTVSGVDVAYDVAKRTVATLGWTHTKSDRTIREQLEQNENAYKISVDSHINQKLDLHNSFETSHRAANFMGDGISYDNLTTVLQNNPFFRRFDVSERRRDQYKTIVTGYVNDKVTVSGSALIRKDDYPDTYFGVTDQETQSTGADIDWQVSKKVSVNGFVNLDRMEGNQRARQFTRNNALTDPRLTSAQDTPSDWTLRDTTEVNTFGANINVNFEPKKNDFALAYSHAASNGALKHQSQIGIAGDNNAFMPLPFDSVDDTRLQTLTGQYTHILRDGLVLSLGHTWERFDIDDYALVGLTSTPTNAAGTASTAFLLKSLPQGYNVNVTFLNVKYRF